MNQYFYFYQTLFLYKLSTWVKDICIFVVSAKVCFATRGKCFNSPLCSHRIKVNRRLFVYLLLSITRMCERAHTASPSANRIASSAHPPNSIVSPLSDWLSCTYTNPCPLGLWWFWSWSCVSTRPVLFRHCLGPVLLPCNCLLGIFASFLPFELCLWIQLCSQNRSIHLRGTTYILVWLFLRFVDNKKNIW